MTALPTISDVF